MSRLQDSHFVVVGRAFELCDRCQGLGPSVGLVDQSMPQVSTHALNAAAWSAVLKP
jgi:hypothetical protein